MKIETSQDDEALSKVLREWRPAASVPPRFQENVWLRIERSRAVETSTPSLRAILAYWIGTLLPRPALALSYVLVLVAVGAAAGLSQARQETARVKDELGQRYLRILNPYHSPRE